jgi:hypothetical protein
MILNRRRIKQRQADWAESATKVEENLGDSNQAATRWVKFQSAQTAKQHQPEMDHADSRLESSPKSFYHPV